MTRLANGNFVVTWHTNVSDPFGRDGYFQLFAPDGTPIGTETALPTGNSHEPQVQALVADGNGGGVAVQFAILSTGLAITASDFTAI